MSLGDRSDEEEDEEEDAIKSLRDLKRKIYEVLPDDVLPPPDSTTKRFVLSVYISQPYMDYLCHYSDAMSLLSEIMPTMWYIVQRRIGLITFNFVFRQRVLACRLLKPEDNEVIDYRLPVSGVVASNLEELKHQTQPFSAQKPKVIGFRESDYMVCKGFACSPAKLDDDTGLLAKTQTKLVVNAKYIEELERLARQALTVASHAEWTLGTAVVLLQDNDTTAAVRCIESVGMAQSHNASLLARSLANITHIRRDQFLATSALSSSAKSALAQLPIPTTGKLFDGKIADTVSKDANTSSNRALVSIASSLKNKSSFKLPKPKSASESKPRAKTSSFNNSFRGKTQPKSNPKKSQFFEKKEKK